MYDSDCRHYGIDRFERLVARRPQSADARCKLGLLYMDAGRYDKAADSFLTALQLSPDNYTASLCLARSCHLLGDYPQAVDRFKAIRRSPPYRRCRYYTWLAQALERLEHYSEAVDSYFRALRFARDTDPLAAAIHNGLTGLSVRPDLQMDRPDNFAPPAADFEMTIPVSLLDSDPLERIRVRTFPAEKGTVVLFSEREMRSPSRLAAEWEIILSRFKSYAPEGPFRCLELGHDPEYGMFLRRWVVAEVSMAVSPQGGGRKHWLPSWLQKRPPLVPRRKRVELERHPSDFGEFERLTGYRLRWERRKKRS